MNDGAFFAHYILVYRHYYLFYIYLPIDGCLFYSGFY